MHDRVLCQISTWLLLLLWRGVFGLRTLSSTVKSARAWAFVYEFFRRIDTVLPNFDSRFCRWIRVFNLPDSVLTTKKNPFCPPVVPTPLFWVYCRASFIMTSTGSSKGDVESPRKGMSSRQECDKNNKDRVDAVLQHIGVNTDVAAFHSRGYHPDVSLFRIGRWKSQRRGRRNSSFFRR